MGGKWTIDTPVAHSSLGGSSAVNVLALGTYVWNVSADMPVAKLRQCRAKGSGTGLL